MGRFSREKGKRAEREVAAMLKPLCPDVRTKRAGGESASVDRGRDLLGTPGLCVQVKAMAHLRPLSALGEACGVAAADELPVAFVKQTVIGANGHSEGMVGKWCAVIRAEDFVGLLQVVRAAVGRIGIADLEAAVERGGVGQ